MPPARPFSALKDNSEYKSDAQKIRLGDPTAVEEIENYVKLAAAASPEVVRRLTNILNPS